MFDQHLDDIKTNMGEWISNHAHPMYSSSPASGSSCGICGEKSGKSFMSHYTSIHD
jgi:hypothetical protein